MTEPLSLLPPELLNPGGRRNLLLVCDHASRAIPPGHGDLGLEEADLARHIGWDIGAAALTRALSAALDAPAILARWSRLMIDVNRPLDHPTLIPAVSDGIAVPGNETLTAEEKILRITGIYEPFHAAVDAQVRAMPRPAAISVHSFTPRMNGFDRPWQIGILWNDSDALARPLIEALARAPGLTVGDNQPYSGKQLYHTLAVHAETRGLPNAGLEIRQDEIDTDAGVARWATLLTETLTEILP